MEFGLLQLLVERRRTVTDDELAYVAWHEIAEALSFRSVQADSENVRERVHRVRRKLSGVHADDLIESKRSVGYRLAGEAGGSPIYSAAKWPSTVNRASSEATRPPAGSGRCGGPGASAGSAWPGRMRSSSRAPVA